MHSRKMKRWQEDQRCIFEIMTDARKIKIFLRWSLLLRESGLGTKRRVVESGRHYVREREEMDVTLVRTCLFSFPIPLSTFCSSREYGHPRRRKLVLSCEGDRSFFFTRRLGKRANFAFMDHQKKQHNAHCALSMYQRFAPSSATSKRMLDSPSS